ncbi:hypothetical protein [Kordiimonas sp. SCSIO 12610]|uniref:hypothetical protein n=1 Tax=Kordiimonas sp. SCSIO 12610 TaxID=2829597 RepID=UPI00210A1EE4|nr:hypothetical protein [Kordiimonas sp. SCSIO 12610]UTW56158.1 hypothetical protein KFF44_04480 [Kordiimonas sp. SCSIO 12610]
MFETLFLSARAKEIIADLKAKDDFRPEGLRILRKRYCLIVIVLLAVIAVSSSMSILTGHKFWIWINLISLGLFILYHLIGKIEVIFLTSVGTLAEGTIVWVRHRPIDAAGWVVSVDWQGPDGNICNRRLKHLHKPMVPDNIKAGDKVTIVYQSDYPKRYGIVFPPYSKFIISKSRYEMLKDRPFSCSA